MSNDPTSPIGKVRVELWGGKDDGLQFFKDKKDLTLKFGKYNLYSIDVVRSKFDEDHSPIYALYVVDGFTDEVFWARRQDKK